MNEETWWILKKDIYRTRHELIVYVLASFVVQANLAFLWWPDGGILYQILLWAFSGFVFRIVCHSDRLAPRDTCWWVTRPLSPANVRSAKCWFGLIAIIGPVFVIRLGLALYCQFDFLSATTVSTLGVLPLSLVVLAIMGWYWRSMDWRRMGAIVAILLAGCCLEIINDNVTHSTSSLKVHVLKSDSPVPQPTTVLDAWLSTTLPKKRLVWKSSFRSTFVVGKQRYKVEGDIEPDRAWYWFMKNQYPEATVRAESVESPLDIRTTRRRVIHREGEEHVQFIRTTLPETPDGETLHFRGTMSWAVAEVQEVWEGRVDFGPQMVNQGVVAKLTPAPDRKIDIRLTGPVTAGVTGDRAFLNWFGEKAIVAVSTADGRDIAVFSAEPIVVDGAWPAFSRRYRLQIPDPRPYFPEDGNSHLNLKIYSVNIDGKNDYDVWGKVQAPLTRTKNPKTCFDGGQTLPDIPATSGGKEPHLVSGYNRGSDGAVKELGARIDKHIQNAYLNSRERILKTLWTEIQKDYDPDNPDHSRQIIERLRWAPQMFTLLPDVARKEGKRKLNNLWENRPITNPVGTLALAENIAFDDEKEQSVLAWCFIHSDRLDRMFSEISGYGRHLRSYGRRCPTKYLSLISEENRPDVWKETWRRVTLEIAMDSRVKTPPDYISEALRRGSPDARRVACVYMRRTGPLSELKGKKRRKQYKQMLELLRRQSDYKGPAGEFESWFIRKGINPDSTNLKQ